jgi:DNA repair protein RadC
MKYANFTDVELLQKLVGIRQAKNLYRGSLRPLFACDPSTVPQEKLLVARELVKRWLTEDLQRGCALSQPNAVRDYLRIPLASKEHEVFVVLFLDAQNRLICSEELFRGTLTQTSVFPREIVKRALHHNAAAAMFAHNHPSGIAEPSRADEALTQTLKHTLALVDVKVLDHFVVGGAGIMSFAERGLL